MKRYAPQIFTAGRKQWASMSEAPDGPCARYEDVEPIVAELDAARAAVGAAWLAGGATLAEAIERKCRMLEGLNATRIPDELARWLAEDHDRVLSVGVDVGEGVHAMPGWYADATTAGGAREDTGYGDTIAEALEDLWQQVNR